MKQSYYGVITFLLLIIHHGIASAQVSLNIQPSRSSGVAPLYVFFDATSSTGLEERNDLVNADFTWNFDVNDTDPNGKWEVTKGMVAGHVFEQPGSYEVLCKLTAPDGSTTTETVNIKVSEFGGTTFYVSAEGDNSHDGLSEEEAWETAKFAFQQLGPNERILFRSGDTFTEIDETLHNLVGGPIIIGAYGEGENPILATPDAAIIDIRNSENIRVMDLHIITTGGGFTEGFSAEESSNILALRLEIEQTSVRPLYQDDGDLLGVFDCELHDFGVLAIYSGSSNRLSFVGNNVDNLLGGTQPEHGMRIQDGEKQFIAYNKLTRLDDTKTAITIRGDGQRHVMVYRNVMDRILAVNPQNAQTVAAISYVTIEGNYIGHNEDYVGNKFEPSIHGINIEATHIAVRNNIIDGYRNAINISHDYNGVVSGTVDVYNNTVHWRPVTEQSGNSGRVVNVRNVSDVIIRNNLVSADDENSIQVVNNDEESTGIEASDNLLTASPGYEATTLDGSAAHLNDVSNYLLTENSPAIDMGGKDVPVFFDLYGTSRANGESMDLGAFEFGSTEDDPDHGGGDGSEVVTDIKSSGNHLLNVFPNPTTGVINLVVRDNYGRANIFDQTGRLVLGINFNTPEAQLDISSLRDGIYYLVVSGNLGDPQSYRIVKI